MTIDKTDSFFLTDGCDRRNQELEKAWGPEKWA